MGIESVEYAKRTRKKKYSCHHKVDRRCLYREECETTCVIYKITCKCCQDYYVGKRQRSLKCRCQEHYQGIGMLWEKKKASTRRLEPPISPMRSKSSLGKSTHPTPHHDGTSLMTRAKTRSKNNNPCTTTTLVTVNGMSHLLSLFSTLRCGKLKTPATIYEDDISDRVSLLTADVSSYTTSSSPNHQPNLSTS